MLHSTLFSLIVLAACVSAQDTLTNQLMDIIDEVVSEMAPFEEDIEQPAPGPGVCYENRTVSYNTTETVIKIETFTSTHFCFDFSAGFKCKKEERREVPTVVPTVKERDQMIAVCCEKFRYMDGKCVAITTHAPSTAAPTFAPSRLGVSSPPPVATTSKPNGAATASILAVLPLIVAYLV